MKKRAFLIVALLIAMGFFFQIDGSLSGTLIASAEDNLPVKVVVVSGSPYEMGMQYGQQAADSIYTNVMVIKAMLLKAKGREELRNDMKVYIYYLEKYDPALRDWVRGISAGLRKMNYNASYEDLVALSIYPGVLWARPKSPYPPEVKLSSRARKLALQAGLQNPPGVEESHSCNSFAATGSATKDGKSLIAVSRGVTLEVMHTLMLIAFPEGRPSYVVYPYAGSNSGTSGMNSAGFAWIMTAAPAIQPEWGFPGASFFHAIAELCKSPGEAQQFLKSTPRSGTVGNFIMGDATGDIFVIEANFQHYAIRKPGDLGENGFVVNTNHFVGPTMKPYNYPDYQKKDSFYRYATVYESVSAAAKTSSIDIDFVKKMFASDDRFDPHTHQWIYNDPGSDLGTNMLTYMSQHIYIPADLTTCFMPGTANGLGIPPYATSEYIKLKLADSPDAVTTNMAKQAWAFYRDARNLFQKQLNAKTPNLTFSVALQIEQELDKALSEYKLGMDKAAVAYLATPVDEQVARWGAALTHYSKAQLLAQMVTTQVKSLTKTP